MTASERVTWDVCPSCGRFAAFGWCDGVLVEVDCPSGCRLTPEDFGRRALSLRGFPPPARHRTPADDLRR
jgi:hypothetical protein